MKNEVSELMKREFDKKLQNTISLIQIRYPFYSYILSNLIKELTDDPNIKTIKLSIPERSSNVIKLLFNYNYFMNELDTIYKKMGAVIHEIIHLVLKHPFRVTKKDDIETMNISQDLVVNQYIEKKMLLKDSILLENYEHFNFKKDQNVDYYYKKLYKELEDEQLNRDKDKEFNHDWDDFKNLNKGLKENIEYNIDNQLESAINKSINESEKSWGSIPSSLRNYLLDFLNSRVSKIDWKSEFRNILGTSRLSYVKLSKKRESKRYETTPGIKIKRKQKIVVCVDTSGSIDNESLGEFFSELSNIRNKGNKPEIHIIESDCSIGNTYRFEGKIPEKISGGGGTDFNPALEFCNENHRDANLFIYFTDGYASVPSVKLSNRTKLLWLLFKNGSKEVDEMINYGGKCIKMNF